ncbi:MAG: (2Fe-2S)-binding protein [Clostridia bacterium]|nr:(2Fe-2S)-binding protein [Clostridia bacterium]
MENYTVCNCKKVSYFDILDALHNCKSFEEVEQTFAELQRITHCSTGCGGCHDKVMDIISANMSA